MEWNFHINVFRAGDVNVSGSLYESSISGALKARSGVTAFMAGDVLPGLVLHVILKAEVLI